MKNVVLKLIVIACSFVSTFIVAATDMEADTNKTVSNNITAEINVINLNQADISTLTSLKGIGNKKAQAIVDYRNKNGAFTDIEQLTNVKGIGIRVITDNKGRLTI